MELASVYKSGAKSIFMSWHVPLVVLLLFFLHSSLQKHHCIHDHLLESEKQHENGVFEQRKHLARYASDDETTIRKRGLYTNLNEYSFGPLDITFRMDYASNDYGSRTCYVVGQVPINILKNNH